MVWMGDSNSRSTIIVSASARHSRPPKLRRSVPAFTIGGGMVAEPRSFGSTTAYSANAMLFV